MKAAKSEYLSVSRVAEIFGVGSAAVRGWIREGILEARRDLITNRIYVPVSAVDARKAQLQPRTPGATKEESNLPKTPKEKEQQNTDARVPAQPARQEKPAKKEKKWSLDNDLGFDGDEEEDD